MSKTAVAAAYYIDPGAWMTVTATGAAISAASSLTMDGLMMEWVGVPSHVLLMALAGSCTAMTFCPPSQPRSAWRTVIIGLLATLFGAVLEPAVASLAGLSKFSHAVAAVCGFSVHFVGQFAFAPDFRSKVLDLLGAVADRIRGGGRQQ